MNQCAADMIALLESVDWFAHVGDAVDAPLKQVTSWQAAARSCEKPDWKTALLESSNDITRGLYINFPDAKHPRNDVVIRIKTFTEPLIAAKTRPFVEADLISKAILGTIDWSILHIVLAAHFGDMYLSPIYTDLADWYVQGHFPCGWEGKYPEGRLIVY
jgi:hypothetical protein